MGRNRESLDIDYAIVEVVIPLIIFLDTYCIATRAKNSNQANFGSVQYNAAKLVDLYSL